MNYAKLLSPHHVAALHDWLAETGELYVQVGSQYDRAAANAYFITDLGQLKTLLSTQSRPSFEIYIFRDRQYPIRGIASRDLFDEVLRTIPVCNWYTIIARHTYPRPIDYIGAGKNYSTLKEEIMELEGRMIAIGMEPMDYYDWRSMLSEPVKVMYFAANENVESYEEYTESPGRYADIIRSWEDSA